MKTSNHKSNTRERMSIPSNGRWVNPNGRKARRAEKNAQLKAIRNEREHDERAVKFHF